MAELTLAALLEGEPGPLELWTLQALAGTGCSLSVLEAEPPARARPGLAASFAARVEAADRALLEGLFDAEEQRAWWREAGIPRLRVPSLAGAEALEELSRRAPDLLVRVSGGPLAPEALRRARLGALSIQHGLSPGVRGPEGIPRALLEGRAGWIGASVHLLDEGGDTGPVLWRGRPQLAPGDVSAELLFRAHLEAVEGLAGLVASFVAGRAPAALAPEPGPAAASRPSGPGDWVRFLLVGRGRTAPVSLRAALERQGDWS